MSSDESEMSSDDEYYGNNALLLASDHKVMRSYYTISSEISIIGSSALY